MDREYRTLKEQAEHEIKLRQEASALKIANLADDLRARQEPTKGVDLRWPAVCLGLFVWAIALIWAFV